MSTPQDVERQTPGSQQPAGHDLDQQMKLSESFKHDPSAQPTETRLMADLARVLEQTNGLLQKALKLQQLEGHPGPAEATNGIVFGGFDYEVINTRLDRSDGRKWPVSPLEPGVRSHLAEVGRAFKGTFFCFDTTNDPWLERTGSEPRSINSRIVNWTIPTRRQSRTILIFSYGTQRIRKVDRLQATMFSSLRFSGHSSITGAGSGDGCSKRSTILIISA